MGYVEIQQQECFNVQGYASPALAGIEILGAKVMGEPKILIYRCLDDDDEDEETDLTGEIKIPRMGDLLYRKEKTWKVTGIYADTLADPIPRFRIHLLDMTKPEFVN
jgi:hypothetical protein